MIRNIEVGIYRCNVVMMIESDKREFDKFKKANKWMFDDDESESIVESITHPERCDGFTMRISGTNIAVFFRYDKPEIVAHEIFHCAWMMLRDRAAQPTDEDAEPLAYLIGWLTEMYYKFKKEKKNA